MKKEQRTKGMQLRSFIVSEKLKIRNKGNVGTYFTRIGRKEFPEVLHFK
jgi:hypothetical protein